MAIYTRRLSTNPDPTLTVEEIIYAEHQTMSKSGLPRTTEPACLNVEMNPVRLWPGFGVRSYGVNVLNSFQGHCPNASEECVWYGVCIM